MQSENHYTETDLGNVAPNPRGNFDSTAKYEYLDLVAMQGGSYLCLAELGQTITGIAPEAGKNTEHWQCVAIPGNMTPEYTDAYDKVVRLAREVEQDAAKVAEDKQSVTQMETNTRRLKEQTEESARLAEGSKDSAAGSAREAKKSEESARQAENNVRTLVNGFDTHVEEKTTEATQAVATAKDNAVQAVERQETASVQEVKDQTATYITEQKNLAKQELDDKVNQFGLDVNVIKAEVSKEGQKQITNVQEATTTELTKIAEKGTEQTGLVTAEGNKQVKAVQTAAQEIAADRKQIQKNKADIASLAQNKADAIVDTAKGEYIAVKDSSGHLLENLKIFGKTEQTALPSPENPQEIINKKINNIGIFGKNLLVGRYYYVSYSSGIGYIKNDLVPELPYTPPTESDGVGKIIHCKKGMEYTFSVTNPNNNHVLGVAEYASVEDAKNHNNKIKYVGDVTDEKITYTASGNGILLCYIAGKWTDGHTTIHTCADTELLQVEFGAKATKYEYKEKQTIQFLEPITLCGLKVDFGGNCADSNGQQWISDVICKQNGKWGIKKYLAEKTIDQNVTIQNNLGQYGAPETTTILARAGEYKLKRKSKLLCDKLPCVESIWDKEIEGIFTTENTIDFRISKERLGLAIGSTPEENATALKKYLETNPLYFVAQLETPKFEPFSDEIQQLFNALHTNYPTTVATNNAWAEMELTYIADTKLYVKKELEKIVSAQIQDIANLLSLMPLETQAGMIETDVNNILENVEEMKYE